MVQKVRDRIIHALIVVVTGIIVSIFSVAYANNKLDSREQSERIDDMDREKLSRAEYIEDQEKRESKHDIVHEKEYETEKEFRTWMRDEMKGLREDVRSIK